MSKFLGDFPILEPSWGDFGDFCKNFVCLKAVFFVWCAANEPLLVDTSFNLMLNFFFNYLIYKNFLVWSDLAPVFPDNTGLNVLDTLFEVSCKIE